MLNSKNIQETNVRQQLRNIGFLLGTDIELQTELKAFGLSPKLSQWLYREFVNSSSNVQESQHQLLPIGYNPNRNLYKKDWNYYGVSPDFGTFWGAITSSVNQIRMSYMSIISKDIVGIEYLEISDRVDRFHVTSVVTKLIRNLLIKGMKIHRNKLVDEQYFEELRESIPDGLSQKKNMLNIYIDIFNETALFVDTLVLNYLLTFVIPNMDMEFLIGMRINKFGETNVNNLTFTPSAYHILFKSIGKFFPMTKNVGRHWLMAMAFVVYAMIESMVTVFLPINHDDSEVDLFRQSVRMKYQERLDMIISNLYTSDSLTQRKAFQTASERLLGGYWYKKQVQIEGKPKAFVFTFADDMFTDMLISRLDRLLSKSKGRQFSLPMWGLLRLIKNAEDSLLRGDWNFENPAWFVSNTTNPELDLFKKTSTAFTEEEKRILVLARAKNTPISEKSRKALKRIKRIAKQKGFTVRDIGKAARNNLRKPPLSKNDVLLLARTYTMSPEEKKIYARGVLLPISVEKRRRLIWNLAIALVHMARGGTFGRMVVNDYIRHHPSVPEGRPASGWRTENKHDDLTMYGTGYALVADGPIYTAPKDIDVNKPTKLFVPKWTDVDPKKPVWPTDEDWMTLKPPRYTDTQWNMLKFQPTGIDDASWLTEKPERVSDFNWIHGKPRGMNVNMWLLRKPRGVNKSYWVRGKPTRVDKAWWLSKKPLNVEEDDWLAEKPRSMTEPMWLNYKPHVISDSLWLLNKPRPSTGRILWTLVGPQEISTTTWLSIKPENVSVKYWTIRKPVQHDITDAEWLAMRHETETISVSKWLSLKPTPLTDAQWQQIIKVARRSMELTSWQKAIVAYVAIFLLFGQDGNDFHVDSQIVWTTFAKHFVNLN